MITVKAEPEDAHTQVPPDNVRRPTDNSEDVREPSSEKEGNRRKRLRLNPDCNEEVNDKPEEKPIKLFKNPKVKFKAERAFNEDTLHQRLCGVDHTPVDNTVICPEVRDSAVPRELISYHYGGNTQETFPSIGKSYLNRHGLADWMFPNLDYNPACPQLPGYPGLLFVTTPEVGNTTVEEKLLKIRRVITRLATGQWLYMGDYSLTKVAPLTTTEWAEQYPAFKKTWSREICKKVKERKVLKRMAARKRFNCKDPDENQLLSVEESGEWNRFSPEDVENAFTQGEETLEVWMMVCHAYDADFQRDLHEKSKSWPSSGQKSKSEEPKIAKGKASKKKATKSKGTRAGKKRKRAEFSDSELSKSEPDVIDLYDDSE